MGVKQIKPKIGRPTKYSSKYCEQLIKYFDIEPHFETPVVYTNKDGSTKEEVKLIPSDLPTLAGFAKKIKVHRDTLNQWERDHKEFSDAIKEAKECQESILVTNGLHGLYQGAFAIFTAKNILNWRDKQDTDITTKGDKFEPLQIVITEAVHNE